MTPLHDPGPSDDRPSDDELARDEQEARDDLARLERERDLERTAPHGPDDQAPAEELFTVPDERLRKVLEDNGFATIQNAARSALSAIGAIPLEALDAVLLYHDEALARLRLNPDPAAKEAAVMAEEHGRYLTLARRFRRELEELGDRVTATRRILEP